MLWRDGRSVGGNPWEVLGGRLERSALLSCAIGCVLSSWARICMHAWQLFHLLLEEEIYSNRGNQGSEVVGN